MSRPIWTGSIAFGLVTIPVQLFTAVQDRNIKFHLVTKDGRCRLRRKLYCPETGKEYNFEDTARGYEVAPGEYVIIDPEELERLQPESGRRIEIIQFCDITQIDPIYYQQPYYVVPKSENIKAYQLFVESLVDSGRVAIAKFVMREHEYLCVLRPHDKILILETLNYADEIKRIDDFKVLEEKVDLNSKEKKLAMQLIDTLFGDFDPKQFHDQYRDDTQKIIDEKLKGHKIKRPTETAAPSAKVINLMDALKKSLKDGQKGARSPARKGRKSSHSHKHRSSRRAAS